MTATSAPISQYLTAPNRLVSAANGIDYAYRVVGEETPALVLLQHFRGNLDNWDPALVDALARGRRVVTFDNAGVGGSTGTTPSTIAQMARDAIAFFEALDVGAVDLLGFSIGSFVAQEIALISPAVVRRLVLASSAPRGAAGMHGWAPEVIGAVGAPERNPDGYLGVFFTGSAASRQAGVETLGRLTARRDDRDTLTSWQTRQAQYDAVCDWGIPDHGQLQRVSAIGMPVFVANGDRDPMILPHFSYLLAGLIPQARVKIYPDAAHGFLFQHHAGFALDVDAFLGSDEEPLGICDMKLDVPEYAVLDEVWIEPSRTALVVIDMQNDYVKQGGSLLVPDAEATVPAIKALLDVARASRIRVVYSQDTHREGDPEWTIWPEHCREGSWGWKIVGELTPAAEDTILRKFRYDAFYGTPLDHLLRLWGVDTLVICGTLANISVHYTAASAALRWYAVVIPRDAISALEPFDLEASLRQTVFVSAGRLTTADGVRCRESASTGNARGRSADPSLEML